MAAYIENACGLQDPWEDAAVIRAMGASAFEVAVLWMVDEDAAARAADALTGHLTTRERDFTGYAPVEANMAAKGRIRRNGDYVGLFICPNTVEAEAAFERGLSGEVEPDPTETEQPADDIDALMDRALDWCELYGGDVSDLERIGSGDTDRLKAIIEGGYGVTDLAWERAAIARGKDGSVFEVTLVLFSSDRTALDCVQQMVYYLDAKEDAHARFPTQAELLSNADAKVPEGSKCAVMVVGTNPMGIAVGVGNHLADGKCTSFSGFTRHFDKTPAPSYEPDPVYPDRVKFDPPNEDDMSIYDTDPIRTAWAAGDPAGLSDGDRAVYDAAQAILGEILQDGMTDLEKEKAIYRWLVNHVDYDWRHQDVMLETPRRAFEPYGGLVDRAAVCLGYAASFQLLCDLAGVECITVVGACFKSTGDHAWNMVRLNGSWYCVDVTWDSNYREQGSSTGQEGDWRYFNVTTEQMLKTDRHWDYTKVPEATAEDHAA